MTTDEARKVFNDTLVGETDPERRANVELLREYFTNPEFRAAVHDMVAAVNGVRS